MAADMNSMFKIVTDLYQLLRNSDQGQLVLDGKAKFSLPVFVLEKLNHIFLQLDTSRSAEAVTTDLLQNIIYLQDFIKKAPKLKLTHLKGPPPSEVDITRFVNLRYIELVHVNLQNVKGLQALRPQLELLACTSSNDMFEDILAGDADSLQIWEELRTLDLSYNKIELLGSRTFISTPWIQHLDLSSNKLTSIGNALEYLNNLKYLNLSYNQLDSLPFLSQESYRKLQVLLLCHNFIEDISDIWLFNNLNKLDLSHNLLDDHVNITSLAELKKLQWLSFIGNPFSYHRYHRTYTCVCLSKSIPVQSIILDNQKLSSDEMKVVGTRSGRAVYTTPYQKGGRKEGTSRKYRRTVSSTSSANSVNTVICASVHQPSVGSINEVTPGTDSDVPGTSGTQRDDKLPLNSPISKSVSSSTGRKMPRKSVLREAVIVDADEVVQPPPPLPKPDGNDEHLEIKKELEVLRERFGEDHWLHSHAGSFVQDLLGLQKTPRSSSILSEMTSSQVSFEEENNQQSKFNSTKDGQKQSKVLSSEEKGSENLDKTGISKDLSPVENKAKTDNVSSFSPYYSGDSDNLKRSLMTDDSGTEDRNNALGYTSASEQYTTDDDSSTRIVAGANTADEGCYVDDDYDEDEEEDDDKDDYTHLWLVQKVSPSKLEEVFLVLKEKELLERDTFDNHTLVRWGLSTLLSCVKISTQPPVIQLTFDTIRRNCEQRTYVMEQSDSQVILQRLGEVLESRPLSAMNQLMFRCMKCSSLFSRELKTDLINLVDGFDLSCEVCGSTLVVKVDEDDGESEHLPSSGKPVNASSVSNSANSSSITNTSSNYGGNNNDVSTGNVTPAVPVTQSKLSASPSQCSIGSAASLDQSSSRESPAAGLGDSNNVTMSSQSVRCDSDIEIISNPSQSSIEVLEVQARLQGTNTPNRKRSSEERQTVAVPQLMTVPEVINNTGALNTNVANTGTMLTESSSSGSLTDSICTAYENHPPVSNSRRLPSQGSVGDKLVEETSADNSPDNKNASSNFIMQPPPSPGKNYSSILQDLLNSVNSKLETPSGNNTSLTPTNLNSDDDDTVRYNYNNFCDVDHRIKLFLYEKLFKNDDEHLILLLRGDVMDKTNSFYPGCLVISTYSCFLLKVTGKECGDDAEKFLDKVFTLPLAKLKILRVSWDQGVLLNTDNNRYLLILHDIIRTNEFLKFVSNSQLTSNLFKCLSDDDNETVSSLPYVDSDRYMLLQNVLSANNNIKDSNNICTLSITCSTTIKRDNETDVVLQLACIANTGCDLFILTSDLGWLYKEDEIPVIYTVHNIINLIDVSLQGYQLSLHFLDESEGIEESWVLTFETVSAISNLIESIRKPWEEIFSVPLHVTEFKNNAVV